MSSFARRIAMHKSLYEKDLMYISIGWSHVLIAYIELESIWIHDCQVRKVDYSCSSGKTC
jgi:hypothetical protein